VRRAASPSEISENRSTGVRAACGVAKVLRILQYTNNKPTDSKGSTHALEACTTHTSFETMIIRRVLIQRWGRNDHRTKLTLGRLRNEGFRQPGSQPWRETPSYRAGLVSSCGSEVHHRRELPEPPSLESRLVLEDLRGPPKHQGTWSAYLGGFYRILYTQRVWGALSLHWAFLTRQPWRQPRTRIACGGRVFWRAAKAAFTRVSCVAMSPTGGGASSSSRVFPLGDSSEEAGCDAS
jgi:hypothetical protein